MQAAESEALNPLRVRWARYATGTYGGFIGYSNVIKSLMKIVDDDRSSTIALHCTNPPHFRPDKGARKNVLITMWESRDLPRQYIQHLRQADALIVPSRFCQEIFSAACDCPVFYMPLAVDPAYQWVKRKRPERFRWLWVNAPDPRKGYHFLARIWEANFLNVEDVELYLKTTNNTGDKVERVGNVTFDSRILSKPDLVKLYQGAHGYLYPSMGEGFGFTIAEAMATGLPSVAAAHSGYTDFFNATTGFPCTHEMVSVRRNIYGTDDQKDMSVAEDGDYRFARCEPTSFVMQMLKIMRRYDSALEVAKNGSKVIRRKFNLETMRNRLAYALKEVGGL